MKFVITVTFLVAAIIVSKKLGASGAKYFEGKMKDYGKKYSGAVGQQTIGRASTAIKDSDAMKKFVARNPRLIGNMALGTLTAGSKATFGGEKGGFAKRQEEGIKKNLDNYKYVQKNKQGDDLMIGKDREIWINNDTGAQVAAGSPNAHVVTEKSEKAGTVFISNIGSQRKRFERGLLPLSSWLKSGKNAKPVTVIPEKYEKDKNGKDKIDPVTGKKIISQQKVESTVGGKQTVVDRETILKIKKESGKSDKDKFIESLKKEAEDEVKKDVGDSGGEKKPEGGGEKKS
jgi:hypothetical protein